MIISIDRRTDGAGGQEVKFTVLVKPLDAYHTHGELTRCDKAAVTAALVKAADEIAAVLRRNGADERTRLQPETRPEMRNGHRVDTDQVRASVEIALPAIATEDEPLPLCGERSPDGLLACDKARGHSAHHGNEAARRGW